MSTELDNIWSRVQAELATAVDESTFKLWLKPLQVLELDGDTLLLQATPQTYAWVRDRFARLLQTSAAAVLGPDIEVHVIAADPGARGSRRKSDRRPRTHSAEPAGRGQPPREVMGIPELAANPKLSFEQFVIGDGNRLAHAAALTVAELPGQSYNPLFICGPPGVGKTHLMHSIAGLLQSHRPELTVRATTGEVFTTQFLQALSGGQIETFKARFRHVDVLLIDDVQFFERKTKTEEEFFHTFNFLYDSGSQIVLSSDRPPRDLQALEDRLRERFEAGLVADVRPPDFNTRLAILRKRAHHDRVPLADDLVLGAIAERITDNVRTLEGALIRVVAYSSLTARPLTSELAREVLDNLYPLRSHVPRTLADIQAAACEHFGISAEELLSPSRAARIAWPRQVAMFLARELTDESLPAIGRHFGGRDHTTVMHACKRAAARIDSDPGSRSAVDNLRRCLHSTQS